MSNSQFDKLKSGIKNVIGYSKSLNLSSNVFGDPNDETNFPHSLLLTDTQVSRFRKAVASSSLANVKLCKTQRSKMAQLEGFYVGFLGPLLKTGLPSMANVLEPLPKSVLISLRLTERVYNGPSIAIRPSVCAVVVPFLCTLK